jgi:hypothetical protein
MPLDNRAARPLASGPALRAQVGMLHAIVHVAPDGPRGAVAVGVSAVDARNPAHLMRQPAFMEQAAEEVPSLDVMGSDPRLRTPRAR